MSVDCMMHPERGLSCSTCSLPPNQDNAKNGGLRMAAEYEWHKFPHMMPGYELAHKFVVWKIPARTPGWMMSHVDIYGDFRAEWSAMVEKTPDRSRLDIADELVDRFVVHAAKQEGPFLKFKEAKAAAERHLEGMYLPGSASESDI